ncbi:MAG: hypothetical protein JNN18_23875 [Rubrivivax sp.]|nr:hypothetical protein [Rubrivivax sp.]
MIPRSLARIGPALACAFSLTLAAAPSHAQTKPAVRDLGVEVPTSAIYIGNSFFYYNNSLHGHVGSLLSASTPRRSMRGVSITISGSGFDWHDVDSYFRPNAVSSYSFTPDNKIVTNRFERLFDVAIMMDCSQCPVNPDFAPKFVEYAKRHVDTVRKHGAKPVLFMSWAYQDVPAMTAQLAEAYTQAGNANNAMVIPAGLAFAKSVAQRPQLNLYAPDKRHPSMAGTYLSAVTVYAALFKLSPVGNPYTAGLDEATARHLQQVAWDTVQEYYGR